MTLDFLKAIWALLKKQSPEVVRFICIILILWIFGHYTLTGVHNVLLNNEETAELYKQNREKYTIEITQEVNERIEDILSKDLNASNVLLMNYHNTLMSSNGLAYKYLTAICELFQGSTATPCIEYWKELDYMNYGTEILKINADKYLILQDTDTARMEYPKFTYLLGRSGAKTAIFYPIIGVDENVGMLVVLYKDHKTELDETYLNKVISPNIQVLSTMLDYNYVAKLREK